MTPDELGDAWDGGKLHLPLSCAVNGKPFGCPNAGDDMTFDFPALIAHAAKTRPLARRHDHRLRHGVEQGPGRRAGHARSPRAAAAIPASPSCAPSRPSATASRRPPFLHFGDTVRIEMKDESGRSIFGAIEQEVVRHER